MIFDLISNIAMYKVTYSHFEDIIAFVSDAGLASLTEGTYEINSYGAFALVNNYDTMAIHNCFIEGHNRYNDIHIMLSGAERIGICQRSNCIVHQYNAEKDFLKMEGMVDYITLKPGLFALFLPHDGHMPKVIAEKESLLVTKMVIKFPV